MTGEENPSRSPQKHYNPYILTSPPPSPLLRYQQYVGPVSYVSVDSNRGIIVASETGVLAHIGTQDGDLREP